MKSTIDRLIIKSPYEEPAHYWSYDRETRFFFCKLEAIEIIYIFKGEVRKYRPDFIIRLKNGKNLILETKGQDTQQDKTKREFLDEWVKAVNQQGGFGIWQWSVSKYPADVAEILEKVSEV